MLGVVIVSYNSGEQLEPCLTSLRAHAGVPLRVIVVDNASSDRTVAMVRERFPEVEVLENVHNLGFGAACNQGIRKLADGPVLILNPDIVVEPGSLQRMLETLSSDPLVGIVGAALYYPQGDRQASCRTIQTPWLIALRRLPLGRWRRFQGALERHLHQDTSEPRVETDWLLGACMLVRREAMEAVGLFDERYFLYFEDVDWCYRMWAAGWKVICDNQARMIHHHNRASAESSSLGSHALRLHLRSAVKFFRKYPRLIIGRIPGFLPSSQGYRSPCYASEP